MTHLTRVLAAVDFSTPARGAFEYALALSARHGAELVVVHAVPPDHSFSSHAAERLALIAELRQRAEQADVPFTDRVQHGDPAEIILLHAGAVRPDLIVMGTHRRRGLGRFLVKSVAERVAARATVPVLSVPARRETDPIEPFRHVAVAVDFSTGSHRAIEAALAVASAADDRITLLHAVPGFSSGIPRHLYRYGVVEYQAEILREAWRRLRRAIPTNRPTRAAIHTRALVGETTTEISRAVDDIGGDLLVVGASRRGALARAVFGTTVTRLLRAIRIPMLTVPDVGTAGVQDKTTSLPLAA
jgi:nucleotide-binding universal stress UspA family protein